MERARHLAEAVRRGDVRAVDLVGAALERARADDHGAFISLASERALARAAQIDADIMAGIDVGPLAGVPLAVKDNISTAGVRTTAGSALLRDYIPPHDATVVARAEAAGGVVIGKTNLDEFGMGSSSETSFFGGVRHPEDRGRIAGGSSGGSAVAVARGIVPLALGTDTGGSVRQPAAFCGVFGFKPSYGRLSRSGVIAYASSLDQVGLFAHDAEDAGLLLRALSGHDPLDATSARRPEAELDERPATLEGVRVGRIRELHGAGVDAGVREALAGFAAALEMAGATVVDVELPLAEAAVASYYLIATSEASSNLARFDGTLYGARQGVSGEGHDKGARATRSAGFGPEVQRRILMGSFALSAGFHDAYAARAARVRRRISDQLAGLFSGVDVLLSPTAPSVAWRLGERLHDPLSMYVADVATCLANLAGLPALSLPAGRGEHGLPVGAQLMAPAWREAALLGWASAAAAAPLLPLLR